MKHSSCNVKNKAKEKLDGHKNLCNTGYIRRTKETYIGSQMGEQLVLSKENGIEYNSEATQRT